MPGEINRIVADSISNYLFPPTQRAVDNLKREGINSQQIFLVGNVMIDSLHYQKEKAEKMNTLEELGVKSKQYALMTMHRPSNVDQTETLNLIIDTLVEIEKQIPIIFPIHPRTYSCLEQFGLLDKLNSLEGLIKAEPFGYLPFLKLMNHARFILTDSGGIQEESAALNVPCLILRENTERTEMVEYGSSVLVGNDKKKILEETERALSGNFGQAQLPEMWDGRSAERIIRVLVGI